MNPLALTSYLLIEFLDELVQGLTDTAWPSIRTDLKLSYVHLGLLLWLPRLSATLLEPILFVLADTGRRRQVVALGAFAFAAALILFGMAGSFGVLLAALVLFYPASGAFVSISQASLMDASPGGRARRMALWTAAGSAGNLVGPLLIAATVAAGLSWRPAFLAVGLAALPAWFLSRRVHTAALACATGETASSARCLFADLGHGLAQAFQALRQRQVLHALTLLEAADCMADILSGFLALFLVEAAGFSIVQAAIAMTVWTAANLIGNLLLIPLLARFDGLRMVRVRAFALLVVFPAFVVAATVELKFFLLALTGLLASGWYPVLKARLFEAIPEKSGTVQAIDSAFGTIAGIIPFGLGLVAETFGITATLWLLLGGVVVIAVWGRERRPAKVAASP